MPSGTCVIPTAEPSYSNAPGHKPGVFRQQPANSIGSYRYINALDTPQEIGYGFLTVGEASPREKEMSYENAPATKMLATHCAVCRRPLVDAKSVELGIGPDCRKKYGFDISVDESARAMANKLVYEIALKPQHLDTFKRTAILRELGFLKLAKVIEDRIAVVRVVLMENELRIVTPYNPEFVEAVRKIPGRKWHKEEKVWSVPIHQRAALWAAMNAHYKGAMGVGPKGPFIVGQAA